MNKELFTLSKIKLTSKETFVPGFYGLPRVLSKNKIYFHQLYKTVSFVFILPVDENLVILLDKFILVFFNFYSLLLLYLFSFLFLLL